MTSINSDAIHLVASLVAKAGSEAELRAALENIVSPVRTEPGCLRYELNQDRDNNRRFVMLEEWSTQEALDAHAKGEAFQSLAAKLDDLLAEPMTLTRLHRIA